MCLPFVQLLVFDWNDSSTFYKRFLRWTLKLVYFCDQLPWRYTVRFFYINVDVFVFNRWPYREKLKKLMQLKKCFPYLFFIKRQRPDTDTPTHTFIGYQWITSCALSILKGDYLAITRHHLHKFYGVINGTTTTIHRQSSNIAILPFTFHSQSCWLDRFWLRFYQAQAIKFGPSNGWKKKCVGRATSALNSHNINDPKNLSHLW